MLIRHELNKLRGQIIYKLILLVARLFLATSCMHLILRFHPVTKAVVRIPDQSSIFTAEAQALCLALECNEDSDYTNYVVYSVSFSCLRAVGLITDTLLWQRSFSKLTS